MFSFSTSKRAVFCVAVLFLSLVGGQAAADSNICYVVADNGERLEQVDRTGGAPVWTDIGPVGVTLIESAALYLDGATVYAADADQLGTLNTSTGAFTATSSPFGTGDGALGAQTFSDVDGLAFDPLTGYFYGSHRRGGEDLLFRIDRTTGAFVPDAFGPGLDYVVIQTQAVFGGANIDDIDDIAIDPRNGQMYAVANNNGSADHLVKIDKATGAVTDVAVFNDGSNNVTDMEGLGFYNNGVFYGTTGSLSAVTAHRNSLWEIDLATAAATQITNIGASSGRSDYESVACLSGGANHITGKVFTDLDRDGVDDGGAGIANVTVQLYLDLNGDGVVDPGDLLVQELTTDATGTVTSFDGIQAGDAGSYDFMTASAGPFVVRIDLDTIPANQSMTTDNLEVAEFPIPPSTSPTFGVTDSNNDFGIGPGLKTIEGTVFNDHTDGDGVLDPGELGEPGVTVRLWEDVNNNGIVDAGDHLSDTTTTDANGDYSFVAGPGNFVLDVDDSTLPSGANQTTNPPNHTQTASFNNLAVDETDSGNDFGFTLPASALTVAKTSNISGDVAPGDQIDYTITITNNGAADAANIVVQDSLPADTSYVAQSTLVTGFAQNSISAGDFQDDFEPAGYGGNDGTLTFSTDWVESDTDGGGSGGGNIRVISGTANRCPNSSNCLRVETEDLPDSVYREFDIASYETATLTYDYYHENLRNGSIVIEVSSDGGSTYTPLKTYQNGPTGPANESWDLTPYKSSNTRVRFRVVTTDNNEFMGIDNFTVTVTSGAGSNAVQTKDNVPGGVNPDLDNGVPSALVTANDDFALQPGQSMTVSYSVTMLSNTSLSETPPESIVNTVSVTSDQNPQPSRATVTDPVGYDYGDIPSSYGTASHIAHTNNQNLFIGSNGPDAESGDSAPLDGSGDGSDEGGVTFNAPLNSNNSIVATVPVTNTTGGDATVCAWLDVNLDGAYDSGEGSCVTVASGGTSNPQFTWPGLPDASGTTYVRIRTTTGTMTAADFTGQERDGEIETYAIAFDFGPTAVTIGQVSLSATRVVDFLTGLNIDQMDNVALAALLARWDPEAAANAGSDRQALLQALEAYLDPDADGQVATLNWDTLEERGTIGFYVERRAAGSDDPWQRVSDRMLPGLINAPAGGQYQLADPAAVSGGAYEYRLIEQEATGTRRSYGPFEVELP